MNKANLKIENLGCMEEMNTTNEPLDLGCMEEMPLFCWILVLGSCFAVLLGAVPSNTFFFQRF